MRTPHLSDFPSPHEIADRMPSRHDLASHLPSREDFTRHVPSRRELAKWGPSHWGHSHSALDSTWGRGALLGAGILVGIGVTLMLMPRRRRRPRPAASPPAYRGNGEAAHPPGL